MDEGYQKNSIGIEYTKPIMEDIRRKTHEIIRNERIKELEAEVERLKRCLENRN